MRKIMKRGFCLFLVAVLLAGLVPCAFADEAMPTGEVEASEAATEAAEETTAPPETAVPSESTEPPSETTEPPEATETTESETEVTEPETDPVEDAVEDDRLAAYASTVTNVLLFDKASPNYTTVLRSQVSVTYNPNGSDAAKTAYIKNLGWHFARYNNVPYEDDPLYCIEPCKNYAASTSGNYMDEDLGVSGSGSTRGSNVWYAMPYSYRQAIALTLLYSRQLWNSNYSVKTTAMGNNPNVSTRIATQFLIYEIVTGLRDADTFNRRGSNGYTSGDVFYNAGVASVSGFAEKYNSIVSSVQNAMKIPSFTSRSSGSAPTITMSGSQVSVALMRIKEPRRSVEYMDNRISLYAAQYGRCAVTGKELWLDEIHCHHKQPLCRGGTDKYMNLVAFELLLPVIKALYTLSTGNPPLYHRDIKPDNILFLKKGDEYTLYLTDFGTCFLNDGSERLTPETMAVGPRMYIAPEYETGRVEEVTEKGDIFSLGKVLWCMINGEPEDFMPSNFWFVDEYDLTRVSNILKRYEGRTNLIEGLDFLLDQQTYTLYIHNTSVVLPKNQGKLLVALLASGDALVTTEQLCMALWGTTEYIDENALQVNLTRLKKTMSALEMKQRIVAVRGMGYRLEAEVSL